MNSAASLLTLILAYSSKYAVDSNLIQAIVIVESRGNTFCARYEPNYKWLYFPRENSSRLGITYETEIQFQKCSLGPIQVMGAVAREHGFEGHLTKLCDPQVGLDYGVRHLKKFLQKYPEESDAISAYNAGSPRKTAGGLYVNQKYVDRVHAELIPLRALKD